MGYTKSDFIYRFRHDLPSVLCKQLEDLIHSTPFPTDSHHHPLCNKEIEALLLSHSPIERIWSGPAFRFPEHIALKTNAVKIDKSNTYLLKFGFLDWIPELDFIQPCLAIIADGHAVSVCQSVRKSPLAEEAGIDTLDAYRGNGYAPLAVIGWAQSVREKGKIPLYSTSWENRASQRVAQKLGLIQYGVNYHIT
ncbi:MAG: GNAT family N-acetyltransferase [Candidatus Latescibacterota bacterium]